jgi:hypothetical protein
MIRERFCLADRFGCLNGRLPTSLLGAGDVIRGLKKDEIEQERKGYRDRDKIQSGERAQ